ncbi:hypothetical protein Droror1_Dr00008322 [Drosera rotundifolia]
MEDDLPGLKKTEATGGLRRQRRRRGKTVAVTGDKDSGETMVLCQTTEMWPRFKTKRKESEEMKLKSKGKNLKMRLLMMSYNLRHKEK